MPKIEVIRNGTASFRNRLDRQPALQSAFGLSEEEFARCLPEEARLRQIQQAWDTQAKPEALKLWFRRPIPAFGGQTPLELVLAGQAEEVLHVLGRFREGVYS